MLKDIILSEHAPFRTQVTREISRRYVLLPGVFQSIVLQQLQRSLERLVAQVALGFSRSRYDDLGALLAVLVFRYYQRYCDCAVVVVVRRMVRGGSL